MYTDYCLTWFMRRKRYLVTKHASLLFSQMYKIQSSLFNSKLFIYLIINSIDLTIDYNSLGKILSELINYLLKKVLIKINI